MSISIVFDKPEFRADEPITFRTVVEDETAEVRRQVTVAASVALPDQSPIEVQGTTTVVERVWYGPAAVDGYTVTQDPADPSRYTATPNAGTVSGGGS